VSALRQKAEKSAGCVGTPVTHCTKDSFSLGTGHHLGQAAANFTQERLWPVHDTAVLAMW